MYIYIYVQKLGSLLKNEFKREFKRDPLTQHSISGNPIYLNLNSLRGPGAVAALDAHLRLGLHEPPAQGFVLETGHAEVVGDVLDQALDACEIVGLGHVLLHEPDFLAHVRLRERHEVLHEGEAKKVRVLLAEEEDVAQAASGVQVGEEAE